MAATLRTQVAIIGAGPAGLVLGRLLHLAGIDSVILEDRSRAYVEQRVRAGVLEQGTVNLLRRAGVAERLDREGLIHHGIQVLFDGRLHRIPLTELTGGRSITVYGQQEVVKDLIQARLDVGEPLLFDVAGVTLHGLTSGAPLVRFVHEGAAHELRCDFVAGCDGFHGVSRESVPAGELRIFERAYPFAWLGVLAAAPASSPELIYAYHERGFALHSMRSTEISRLYLQCGPDEDLTEWPDERIWDELRLRLADDAGHGLRTGPILEKSIAAMRSFVVEPMQYGRLFLAGDAAHIVPPTGAKGLNLAVADVRALAGALAAWYAGGGSGQLDAYSETCLRRVWRAEHFSWWMTTMLHRTPDDDAFTQQLQLAQLRYVTSSQPAAASLAENYVGLETV